MTTHRIKHVSVSLAVLICILANAILFRSNPVAAAPAGVQLNAAAPLDSAGDNYFLTLIQGKEPATDSASAGTAMSTGYKTDDGNVAWKPGDPAGGSLSTIAETLRADKGFAIGVASTVQFSHATPATFVSHNVSRNNYSAIANEILGTVKPEVVIGGGHPVFYSATPDYQYVGGQATWDALVAGTDPSVSFVQRQTGVDGGDALETAAAATDLSAGERLLGVFGGPGGNFEYHQAADAPGAPAITPGSTENPSLPDVVSSSLDVLSQDTDGFFVMFEQGDIDWANHANDFENMIGGVWDLDQAVKTAEDYIAQPGGPEWSDTLVIVTSDHSNSYMRLPYPLGPGDLPTQSLVASKWTYPGGEVTYRTGNHTNELVTIAARGAGASQFQAAAAASWYSGSQIIDNTQIYQAMLDAANASSGAPKHILLFIGDGMNVEHEIAASRYLYGTDMGLAWQAWRSLPDGFGGFVATWDVTTYNKYAQVQGAAPFSLPAQPASLGTNSATIGYDPAAGGAVPYPISAMSAERDAYFLNLVSGKEPATDSASAGTAMSTGYKTDDGNVAWKPGDPAGGSLTTIAETLRADKGFAIGVASTVQFSHATPATFVSHNVSRSNYSAIANEILGTVKPEVVIGGGHPVFYSATPDYQYVGGQATWDALVAGTDPSVSFVQRQTGVDGGDALETAAAATDLSAGERLLGVFGGPGGNFEYHQAADAPGAPAITPGSTENPSLPDVVSSSLDVLSQDADGFFVMFEQGDIDWANHANDFENMIGGVWDLDQAVKTAEDYIAQPGGPEWSDTLVIVTSDHSNSYMRLPFSLGSGDLPTQSLVASKWTYPGGEVTYRTGNHTNELVTIAARGAGSQFFKTFQDSWYPDTPIIDNTQIYQAMLDAANASSGAPKHILLFIGDGMNVEHEIAASRYLYGTDMGLAWQAWRSLPDGFGGFVATWDVTTYNKYATTRVPAAPAYVAPTAPADLGSNDIDLGYDISIGGAAPFPLQASFYSGLTGSPAYLYAELLPDTTTTANLAITESGSAKPNWSGIEQPAAGWFSASATNGKLMSDGATNLTMTFDATGLTPGMYRTNFIFQTNHIDVITPVILKVKTAGAAPTGSQYLTLTKLGSYMVDGIPTAMGAEIVSYDPAEQLLYVTNGAKSRVDVLSIADLATNPNPVLVKSIYVVPTYGADITSVDVRDGMVAIAVPANPKTNNGKVVFVQNNTFRSVTVGALPDMVTFSPDGNTVLVANEGEPSDDYLTDPNGSISIIDVSGGITSINQSKVTTLDFSAFNGTTLDARIRIYGPKATVAQDIEPEYITVSADNTTAWVTLQENNTIAEIDLSAKQITGLMPLGFKDWSKYEGLDATDRDGTANGPAISIANAPVWGMYEPDGIASYSLDGTSYLVTANEGDSRAFEEVRVSAANLDSWKFPNSAALKNNAVLGRLTLSNAATSTGPAYRPDPDGDGDMDALYTLGGRSFSIWNASTGEQVYDSGDDFERILAAELPSMFNADSGDPLLWDTRSDNKGPEPESVTLGAIYGHVYAFIALERAAGGVMIYDITIPASPIYVGYVPNTGGDISPEGIKFIPAAASPTGHELLVLAHEVSGTTSVYEIGYDLNWIYLPLIYR